MFILQRGTLLSGAAPRSGRLEVRRGRRLRRVPLYTGVNHRPVTHAPQTHIVAFVRGSTVLRRASQQQSTATE